MRIVMDGSRESLVGSREVVVVVVVAVLVAIYHTVLLCMEHFARDAKK